jgi:predicted AAA+ superfamily ATPase
LDENISYFRRYNFLLWTNIFFHLDASQSMFSAMPDDTMTESLYPRHCMKRLRDALADTPAVLIHGPRQCGKTTLAKMAAREHGYVYITFDDENVLRSAKSDPVGFCAELPRRAILDEVQRVPELFVSLKKIIDEDRTPGRFLLTGSANVLLLPKLSDSLAGRMEIVRLAPLAQVEIERVSPGGASLLESLFKTRLPVHRGKRLGDALVERVLAGGFPAALARATRRRQRDWHRNYIETITKRDVRELANIHSLKTVPRLLETAAAQTARLFNIAELAAPFHLSQPTIRDYMSLLEQLFLVDILQPWHRNRLNRLVKTPKLHLADTGLAGALLGVTVEALKADRNPYGPLLETFVFQELQRHATWSDATHHFYHYRDKDKVEVDIVIERADGLMVGVEVKAGSTVTVSDFRGLRRLREINGKQFVRGVLFYDGDATLSMGDDMHAVPYAALWEQ